MGDILLKTNIQVIKWKAITQWLETEGHVFAFWDGVLPENQIAVSSSFFKFMQNMEVCISIFLTLQTRWRDIGRENLFEQTGAFPDKPFPESQGLSRCWGSILAEEGGGGVGVTSYSNVHGCVGLLEGVSLCRTVKACGFSRYSERNRMCLVYKYLQMLQTTVGLPGLAS